MNPFAEQGPGHAAVSEAHAVAVVQGANFTGTTHESERICSAQDLLCMAGSAAVDVALIAQVFDACKESADQQAQAQALSSGAAGLTRLIKRALEVHSRDTGYAADIWLERAVEETEYLLHGSYLLNDVEVSHGTFCTDLVRTSAGGVMAALACAPADRMGVPERITEALGASVALFMIAERSRSDG